MLNNMGGEFSGYGLDAQTMALKQMMQFTRQQGMVMAFGDVFLIVAGLFVAFAALIVVMRRPPANATAGTGR